MKASNSQHFDKSTWATLISSLPASEKSLVGTQLLPGGNSEMPAHLLLKTPRRRYSHEWNAVSWPQLNASGTGNPDCVRMSSCSQKQLHDNLSHQSAGLPSHVGPGKSTVCWRLVAQDWLMGIYARSPVRIWKGLIGLFPFFFCVQPNTEIQVGTIKWDASVSLRSLFLSKIPHLYIPPCHNYCPYGEASHGSWHFGKLPNWSSLVTV